MFDPRASRFWQSAIRSGLMDVEGLTACWEAIEPAKRDHPEHIERRLARRAVQLKRLTLWQAEQLLAGRSSGYKVDRYLLLDLIGHGGMGRVYLARDTRLDRPVALKVLTPDRLKNPQALARFEREARMGAQLQHENLVRIYDFGESTGRYFLAMEYIEGQTIATAIADRGPMPPATAVRLVRQVADGLDHIHRKGLVHRDVNPFNILVTHEGIAKLADLGLAIAIAEDDRITRDGATIGTFDYIAPEQARDSRAADARSDIYSLGCTLYHMCSGQVPFPGPTLPEKLLGHQALEPTPLCRIVAGIPEGLGEIVHRMMSKFPARRYATPMEVAEALGPYEVDRAEAPIKAAAMQTAPGTYAGVATNPAFRPYEDDPAAPLLTPDDFDETSDEVRLILDTDPAPPPGAILAQPATRSSTDDRAVAGVAVGPAGWLTPLRLWISSCWSLRRRPSS